jgi:hypothetical protein
MLVDKRKAHIKAFDGPVHPSQYDKIGHHA